MRVLEELRFKSVRRLLLKEYKKGDARLIKKRLYSGYIFCIGGKAIYKVKNKIIELDERHVILAPKNCEYHLDVIDDAIFPVIDFELYSGFFDDVYVFEISEARTFYHNYINMEKQYMSDSASRELMGLSNLYDLTARINGYGREINKYKIIEDAEEYLEKNVFAEGVNIAEIAEKSNISEVYFRRLFKEKYNISPHEYINQQRIKKAKELLLYDNFNISEIAQACGYNSIYSFSRAFKTIVGLSPSDFKSKYIVSK